MKHDRWPRCLRATHRLLHPYPPVARCAHPEGGVRPCIYLALLLFDLPLYLFLLRPIHHQLFGEPATIGPVGQWVSGSVGVTDSMFKPS